MTNTLAFLFGAFLPNKIVITLIQGHALMKFFWHIANNFSGFTPKNSFIELRPGVVFAILYFFIVKKLGE